MQFPYTVFSYAVFSISVHSVLIPIPMQYNSKIYRFHKPLSSIMIVRN